MGIFNFLGNLFRPKSEYEKLRSMVGPMLVKAYRQVARERKIAPSAKTTDKKIVDIYILVEAAFKNAAKQRNEIIKQEVVNYIVLMYYQYYELYSNNDVGKVLFQSHLDSEIKKYINEGLPKHYKNELEIF